MCLAEKCHNLNWKVYGVRRHTTAVKPDFVDYVYSLENINEKLSEIDYVVNLLPETKETKGIYNYSFFKKLKNTAIFCNVGRASSVVEKDLVRAIKDGLIGGAVLDVSENLETRGNIIVTHHNSFKSNSNDSCYDSFYSSQLSMFLRGICLIIE